MQQVSHDEVHQQFDPHFFADYALFSGTLRHYVAKSLEDLLKEEFDFAEFRDYAAELVALVASMKGRREVPSGCAGRRIWSKRCRGRMIRSPSTARFWQGG